MDSTDSYYGPSEPNTLQFDGNEEFISVPSYNKSIVKKARKGNGADINGFNQSDTTLSNRASRFSGQGGVQDAVAASKKSVGTDGEWDRYMGKKTIGGSHKKLDQTDYEKMTIRGTCQTLEKSYLRLTAPPRAELVRPEPILAQHLANLRQEREQRASAKSHDYLWFCSQLKAIRQDCTVQRIQNAFAVDVYELHAKIALEEDDLNEYNQCQTQLKELYELLVSTTGGADEGLAKSQPPASLRHYNEFLAYRLVYFVFLAMESQKYDGVSSEMFKIMLSLSHQQRQDPLIQHALKIREACCSGILDYHAFFRLYRECQPPSADDSSPSDSPVEQSHLVYLLKRIAPAMRHKALHIICKGYRPNTVAVDFVLQELGLFANEENGRAWLQSHGCVLSTDGMELVTKDTVVLENIDTDKQSLI